MSKTKSKSYPSLKDYQRRYLYEMENHLHDALLYGISMVSDAAIQRSDRNADSDILSISDLQVEQQQLVNMDISEIEKRIIPPTRGINKTMLSPQYMKGNFPNVQNSTEFNNIRHASQPQLAIPSNVYQGKQGKLLIMDDVISEAPTTARQDRHYLCMSIPEYQKFAEAVSNHCYINKEGQLCKLKNAKTKKLKNLRYTIRKSPYLIESLIWREQLRLIELELGKRRQTPQNRRPPL